MAQSISNCKLAYSASEQIKNPLNSVESESSSGLSVCTSLCRSLAPDPALRLPVQLPHDTPACWIATLTQINGLYTCLSNIV